MGRGNRGKKKSNNLIITELLDNNKQPSDVCGGFSYNECLTNSKRKKNKKKNQTLSYSSVVDSNKDMDESNHNTKVDTTSEFEANENDTNIADNEQSPSKLTFFDKNDNELELYEKRMMVDMFVNRYWNRICVCEPIEDIIIENDNDNDSDEYFNDY